VVLLLLSLLLGCNNKKVSLHGDQAVELKDFLEGFPELKLPFLVSDTSINSVGDTGTIDQTIFNQFIPDTVFITPFQKKKDFTIHPIGAYKNGKKETYLLVAAKNKSKQAVYVIVFNENNKYSAFMPLAVSSGSKGVITSSSIDKRLNIGVNKEWKKDEVNYYERNVYGYNNVGMFTLILNETNDLAKNTAKEINPLDTFPKNNKFSGDYYKGSKNLVSLRDGKTEGNYLFYIHFENDDEEKCGGELRGELTLTSPTTAIFRENGDPCVIDFSLTGTQVKVKEQGSCGNYRGIRCFFNDTYTKKKEPRTKKASPR